MMVEKLRLWWAEHMVQMRKTRNSYRISVGNLLVDIHLKD